VTGNTRLTQLNPAFNRWFLATATGSKQTRFEESPFWPPFALAECLNSEVPNPHFDHEAYSDRFMELLFDLLKRLI
jgi:hypothetical protein